MKKFITIMIFLLASLSVQAQKLAISGTVKDSKNMPVVGAVVMLSGNSTVATVTDIDGNYTINVPDAGTARLEVTCLSYAKQTIDVNGRASVNVVLEDESTVLDDAVVVGYGSMRRSDLTGSVASVKVDEEQAARSTTIDQLLQGHASGVQVINNSAAPDAGVSIRIRGLSSFNGGSDPLYVVDGVIINSDATTSSAVSGMTAEEGNGLAGLNPQDIASMEILKDASATAIYGSQGANGVILITTKNGKSDKPTITFNAGVDVGTANKHIDVLDFDGYVKFADEIGMTSVIEDIYENPSTHTGLKVKPVDWQDYALRTAVSQRYYLSISGKPKSMPYMFSIGYNDKQGVVRQTGVQQLTMRLNLEKAITDKLKIGTRTNFAYVVSQMTQGANASSISSGNSMTRSMLSYRPYASLNADLDDDQYDSEDEDGTTGPDKWLKYFKSGRTQVRVTPSLYVQWDIVPWLSFKSTFGADYQSIRSDMFKGQKINYTRGSNGSSSLISRFKYNWDNMFMFNKKFGLHSISGTAGMTMTSNMSGTQTVSGWYLTQDNAMTASVNGAVSPYNSTTFSASKNTILSFLARAVYDYRNRYTLTATFRADGSSRFQGANKWAYFPSFAGAWRISEERWFRVKSMSMAKLRLGWGMVGNEGIPSYRTMPLYTTTTVSDHTASNLSGSQIGTYLSYVANPNLKWETTSQVNAGLDMGFFKGRLTFSADYYFKKTKDLLQSKNIARTSGFSTMWVNQGDIDNRGFEFSIDAVPVKTRTIEWTIGGNISLNRNRITDIGADIENGDIYFGEGDKRNCNYFWGSMVRSSTSTSAVLNIFIEGQPMGMFYGLKTKGIVQEGEDWPGVGTSPVKAQPGDVKYVDMDGNGYIDENDRTIIGNPNPDFTFGFNTSFSWKALRVSADFNGSFGNDIYNYNLYADLNTTHKTYSLRNVRSNAYYQAWRPGSPSNEYPRLQYDDTYLSDRFVESGSYLRLSNLSVSYTFNFAKKNKNAILRLLSLGASFGNLFVVTDYTYWDPEVNSYGSDISRMGMDSGSYPAQRTYSLDVKLTF